MDMQTIQVYAPYIYFDRNEPFFPGSGRSNGF